jgi:hypothetical protein
MEGDVEAKDIAVFGQGARRFPGFQHIQGHLRHQQTVRAFAFGAAFAKRRASANAGPSRSV